MLTKLGKYYLDQPMEEIPELKEFNFIEYSLHYGSGAFKLKGEKIFHADQVFNGWKTTIAILNGKIYKICVDTSVDDQSRLNELFTNLLTWFNKDMGSPDSNTDVIHMWKSKEGNIVLQKSGKYLGIFLTSSSIK